MNQEDAKLMLSYCMTNLLPALLIFIVGFILIRLVVKAERKFLAIPFTRVDASQISFFVSGTKVTLWVILLIFVLRQLGLNTAPVITILAAAGAALALALQGSLSNLASGILMLFTKPFVQGDYIVCDGVEGKVGSIGLLYTSLITFDNRLIGLPNSKITSNAVVNTTGLDKRRIEINFRVAYESDLDRAKEAVLDLSSGLGMFLDEPASSCDVSDFEDGGIKLRFWGWVKKNDYGEALDGMYNGLKPALDAAGIKMTYKQMIVRNVTGEEK